MSKLFAGIWITYWIFVLSPTGVFAQASVAQESSFTWQGFATLNYSVSSNRAEYDEFIDENGTLRASSILGVQAAYEFSESTTGHLQVALAREVNQGMRPTVRWAYLDHQFGDGWRARLGRLRFNVYRNSENLEIGSTYSQATLPKEIYINPDYLSGEAVSLSRSFSLSTMSKTEVGFIVGGKELDLALTPNGPAQSSDLEIANAYVSHEFDLDTAVFGGYLMFETESPRQTGVADVRGEVFATSASHEIGAFRTSVEYTLVKLDALFIQGGSVVAGSEFEAEGVSVLLEREWGVNRPYIGYSVYEARSTGPANDLSSFRLGISHQYSPTVLLKAELLQVETDRNPSPTFFNAPVGSSHQANLLTLSYNLVF